MIWETIRDQDWFAYLDVRMGPEAAQVWCVDKLSSPKRASRYAGFLEHQDDSLVPDDPCTSKATFYGGALAASLAAHLLRRIITGQRTNLYYEFDLKSFSALASG
jgi:hypothetical protein